MYILKRPIITEKTMLKASQGWFTFEVDLKANKREIAREIEKMFKVNVVQVRTQIKKGKTKSTGKRRIKIKQANCKKAGVKLREGQKIELFSVQEQSSSK